MSSVNDECLKAFLSGKVIPITEVEDEVFSSKCMGDGVGIIPSSNILYSPYDGTVLVTMGKSKHGCAIKLENGMEIILHVGIDTVNMNGDGFECFIEKGDYVKAGQALIEFDIDKIINAGLSTTSVMIITNDLGREISFNTGIEAIACKTCITK